MSVFRFPGARSPKPSWKPDKPVDVCFLNIQYCNHIGWVSEAQFTIVHGVSWGHPKVSECHHRLHSDWESPMELPVIWSPFFKFPRDPRDHNRPWHFSGPWAPGNCHDSFLRKSVAGVCCDEALQLGAPATSKLSWSATKSAASTPAVAEMKYVNGAPGAFLCAELGWLPWALCNCFSWSQDVSSKSFQFLPPC